MTARMLIVHGKAPLSRAIAWFTRSAASHAALYFDNDQAVIEATWPRVRKINFADWVKELGDTPFEIFHIEVTPEQYYKIRTFASGQLAKPYSVWGDLKFVTRTDYDSLPDDKWFCSELVFQAFKEAGIDLLARTEAWEVPPGWLPRSPLLT